MSIPVATRRGAGRDVGLVRACTSINRGRVPSMTGTIVEPTAPRARSESRAPDGSWTSISPRSIISKTPTSLVDPNRFLTARTMRQALI